MVVLFDEPSSIDLIVVGDLYYIYIIYVRVSKVHEIIIVEERFEWYLSRPSPKPYLLKKDIRANCSVAFTLVHSIFRLYNENLLLSELRALFFLKVFFG